MRYCLKVTSWCLALCLLIVSSVKADSCSTSYGSWSSCSGCSRSRSVTQNCTAYYTGTCYRSCTVESCTTKTYCKAYNVRGNCRSYGTYKSCSYKTSTCSYSCQKSRGYTVHSTQTLSCGTQNGTWVTGAWTARKSCGTGTQTRSVVCTGTACGGTCTGSKPASSQGYDAGSCVWTLASCSGPGGLCEDGMYLVLCEKQNNYNEECRTGCSCSASTCRPQNGSWSTGGWSACSASCGGGRQTRSVSCVGASCGGSCSGSAPASSRSCNTQPCCLPADGSCGSSSWGSSPYGTACEANSWVAAGYCGGKDQRCYVAKPAVNGRVGTAANQVFPNTTIGYAPLTQCASGTPTSTVFPEKGKTASWYCQGSCGGTNSGPHTAYRNRYPTYANTVCPAGYDQKTPCLGTDGTNCAMAQTCENKLACPTTEPISYSDNFVDKLAVCYHVQTCAEANDSRYFIPSVSDSVKYQYTEGLKDGNGQTCVRKKECSEIDNELVKEDEGGNPQLTLPSDNKCANKNSLIIKTSYLNGTNGTPCVTCMTISPPWFQVMNGNLYARSNIVGAPELKNQVYVMRDDKCATGSAQGVGIPVAGEQVKDIPSTKTDATNNAPVALSQGAVSVAQENFDFFVQKFGYDRVSLLKAHDTKLVADLYEANSSAAQTSSGQVYLSNGNYVLDQPLLVKATEKKVLFVIGDLTLQNTVKVENGGAMMFIVAGNIKIDPEVGYFVDPDAVAESQTACVPVKTEEIALMGVFVADGQVLIQSGVIDESGSVNSNSPFYNDDVSRACDKKLIIKGSVIGWGSQGVTKSVVISRNFAGCVKGFPRGYPSTSLFDDFPNGGAYTRYTYDFNGKQPVVTFIYDANLIYNLPDWVRKVNRHVFEVQ